jgi:hypothetical protein
MAITVTGPAPLTLNADGVGSGAGGAIAVQTLATTAGGGDIVLGNAPGQMLIFARGGSVNSALGNGGQVAIASGGNFTAPSGSFLFGPQGNNGNGGIVLISAVGDINISGSLDGSGVGSGLAGKIVLTGNNVTVQNDVLTNTGLGTAGGAITLTAVANLSVGGNVRGGVVTLNSAAASTTFTVGSGITGNGVAGTIQAVPGGTITIIAAGGINIASPDDVLVTPGVTHGGNITLQTPGNLAITVPFGAGPLSVDGTLGLGTIFIKAATLTVNSITGPLAQPGQPLVLSADAGAGFNGGTISVNLTGGSSTLNVGNAPGNVVIHADGFNGGQVTLQSGSSQTIDPTALTVNNAAAGNGGILSITSLNGDITVNGNFSLNSPGNHGGFLTLAANQGQVKVNGSLSVNGALPGLISITTASTNTFIVGPTATTNGVTGTISATGGGSISIQNNGVGGIQMLSSASINVVTPQGSGGSITLSTLGPLTVGAGTLDVSAQGSALQSGGTITLSGSTLNVSGGSTLFLLANGVGAGNGGTINVTVTNAGVSGDLTVDTAGPSNILNISATGGSGGSLGGNGGHVNLSAGQDITINPAGLNINPLGFSGAGGRLSATAGTAGGPLASTLTVTNALSLDSAGVSGAGGSIGLSSLTGNLLVNGNLSAKAQVFGNGGTIALLSNSPTTFVIGAVPAGNGVNGTIVANAGALSGNGANFSFINNGTGGVDYELLNLSASASATGTGNGGSVVIKAPAGLLTMNNHGGAMTITANACGCNLFSGGTIQILSQTLNVANIPGPLPGGSLSLQANGSGLGNGGTVSITTTGVGLPGANINIGTGTTPISVSAKGGSALSISGNGGIITLSSGNQLIIDNTGGAINGLPQGSNGNGPIITLKSTGANVSVNGSVNANGVGTGTGGSIVMTATAGNVSVTGSVLANGGVTGGGGTITILSNSASSFTLGAAGPVNGVGGTIQANSGGILGSGGTIAITNVGVGGITMAGGTVSASSVGSGSGGTITLTTAPGTITFNGGSILANGAGAGADPGGSVTLNSLGVANVSATSIDANGSGIGNGGTISITVTSPLAGLGTLGISNSQLTLSATGGSALSAAGNGGTVTVNVGNNLNVNTTGGTNGLFVGPLGANGKGAIITLTSQDADITVTGNLNANGVGVGNGGTILVSALNVPLTAGPGVGLISISGTVTADGGLLGSGGSITLINNTTANFATAGTITANGGAGLPGGSGSGGSISISNLLGSAANGVTIQNAILANAGGTGTGNGGIITVSVPTGKLTLNGLLTPLFSVSVPVTAVSGNGGVISLTSLTSTVNNNAILNANAAGTGNGGSVAVAATASNATLLVGNGPGEIQVSATGGSAGSVAGNGGAINLSAGDNLTVANSAVGLNAQPLGLNGNGAFIRLAAGGAQSNCTAVLSIDALIPPGTLNGNGVGVGNGGQVILSSGGNLFANDQVNATGGTVGNGGSITIVSNTTNAFRLDAAATLSGVTGSINANGGSASGNGGTITITASGTGGIVFAAGSSVNATGSTGLPILVGTGGNGGAITVSATAGPFVFAGGTLNASGNGTTPLAQFSGGSITLTGNSVLPGAAVGAPTTLLANGFGAGNGGSVTATITGLPGVLTVGNQSGNIMISATGGCATCEVGGLPSLTGNGGTVKLSTTSSIIIDSLCAGCFQVAPLGANGDGAHVSLSASSGNIFLDAGINASGVGNGRGGSISVTESSSLPFIVGATATLNGTTGVLTADAGTGLVAGINTPNGGTISIINNGTGGIALAPGVDIEANGSTTLGGSGGTISILANHGPIFLSSGTISANAFDPVGTNAYTGGTITVTGLSSTVVNGIGPLAFSANGAGIGNGGSITVNTGAVATSNLTIGNATGQLSFTATGGSVGSSAGDGGTISVSTGGNITANMAFFTAAPLGLNGSGANYTLAAAGSGTGNLNITGAIDANGGGASGLGIGNGGSVFLTSSSATVFRIGNTASVNGVNGTIAVAGSFNCTICANGGNGNGPDNAGTVNVQALGTGGIALGSTGALTPVISAQSIASGANGGAGGTLVLNAPLGPLTLGGTLAANATGLAGFKGGAIQLAGTTLTQFGGTALKLNAQAGGPGAGGNVSVLLTDPVEAITLGLNAGQILINTTGSGGHIGVSVGGTLFVNAVIAGPIGLTDGNGASLSFAAGTTAFGSPLSPPPPVLSVNTALSVNGVASVGNSFNGGSIFLSNSDGLVNVLGNLTANGGGGGDGGTIKIQQFGTSSGTSPLTMSIRGITADGGPAGGLGGTVIINTPNGQLAYGSAAMSASATFGTFDGGSITITAASITSSKPLLAFKANGFGAGNGGAITLTTTDPLKNLVLGASPGQLQVQANSGLLGGNGGQVTVDAGGNLTVNALTVQAGALGSVGVGGIITLEAGASAGIGSPPPPPANLFIAGNLSANGPTGGGQLILSSLSGLVTVNGNLNAFATNSGSGGQVTVTTSPTGGVRLIKNINISAAGSGSGGTFTMNVADTGTYTFGAPSSLGIGGVVNANGAGPGGAGGIFTVLDTGAGGLPATPTLKIANYAGLNLGAAAGRGGLVTMTVTNGDLILPSSGTLSVNGSGGNGRGGNIVLTYALLGVTASATASLSANGSGVGGGGNIILNNGGGLTIGTSGAKSLSLSAASGGAGGFGGSITLSATGNITVNSGGILNVSAVNGNGGTISLTAAPAAGCVTGCTANIVDNNNFGISANAVGAGNGGKITLSATAGTVFVNGNVTANGAGGGGFGGSITISEGTNASAFTLGSATPNGVNGIISANAGTSGDGGTIVLTNSGTGGITLGTPSNLQVSTTIGNGGTMTLTTAGALTMTSGGAGTPLAADAAGGGNFTGGTITIKSKTLAVTGGTFGQIEANGSGNGTGGIISVTTTGGGLTFGDAATNLQINATGGSALSAAGTGGSIFVVATGLTTINIDPASLTQKQPIIVTPLGNNGSGGLISITTSAGNLVVNGDLHNDGVGNGNGGQITLQAAGFVQVNNVNGAGNITADAGAGVGSGGTIQISSSQTTPFILTGALLGGAGVTGILSAKGGGVSGNGGTVSVASDGASSLTANSGSIVETVVSGNGGGVSISDAAGTLTMNTSVIVNGVGNGRGGGITLNAKNLVAGVLLVPTSLSANGAGTGGGGTITVVESGNPLTLDSAVGSFQLSATSGGGGGSGGSINVSAGLALTVNNPAASVNVSALGNIGNGGSITLTAGNAGTSGDLVVNGGLSVTGGSVAGNGGSLTLISKPGAVSINGPLVASAQALAAGNGGNITITSNEPTAPFLIGGPLGGGPGVNGSIVADGGAVGSGGNITIVVPKGGFTIIPANFTNSLISASATGNGNGGLITMTSSTGGLAVSGGTVGAFSTINASAASNGTQPFIGGTISIVVLNTTSTTPVSQMIVSANGVNHGIGGTINIKTTGTGSAITLGANPGQIQLNMFDGGVINVISAGNLTVNGGTFATPNPSAINLTCTCNLGTVLLQAGVSGASTLAMNGVINLPGATLTLTSNGTITQSPISGNANVAASSIIINATSDVGSSATPFSLTTNKLSVNTPGNAFINSNNNGVPPLLPSPGTLLLQGSSANTLTLTNDGNIITLGPVVTTTMNLSTSAGSNASIFVQSALQSTGTMTITADGSGIISGAGGTINAGTLNVASGTGNIGSALSPLEVTAGTLTASTAGSAFITNTGSGALTVNNSPVGNTFDLVSTTNINITQPITSSTINISGFPFTNVSVAISNTVGTAGVSNVAITATGTGTLTTTGSGLVSGSSVTLTSANGSIGTSAAPFLTNANTLIANATGATSNVFVSNAGSVNLGTALLSSGAGGTFQVTDTGTPSTITTVGNITAGKIVLQGASGTNDSIAINGTSALTATGATGSVALTATGTGTITQASASPIVGNTLTLTSGTGNIGNLTTQVSNLAVTTGTGNATVTNTGNLNLNQSTVGGTLNVTDTGNVVVAGATSANSTSIDASGSIAVNANITGTGAATSVSLTASGGASPATSITEAAKTTITANTVTLLDPALNGGDLGTSTAPISITTPSSGGLTLFANTGIPPLVGTQGNVFINVTGAVNLGASSGNNFNLTSSGAVNLAGNTTTTGNINLNTNTLNTFPAGGTSTLTSTTGSINVTSAPGQPLVVGNSAGPSTITFATPVGAINLTATGTATQNPGMTLNGNLFFDGFTNLNATQAGQFITLSTGAVMNSHLPLVPGVTVNVNTSTFNLNGSVVSPPIHLQVNSRPGTATISSTSNLIIPKNLIFNGNSLVLIAQNNVIAASGVTQITLKSTNRSGGDLTVLAGFDFTPVPGGFGLQVTGPDVNGGSIIMPKVTINNSSTVAFKPGNPGGGGNVTMIAQQGTTGTSLNAGLISVGGINTSANLTGISTGGNVLLVGGGGVQVNGTINTKGAIGGTVTISGSQPHMNGSPVIFNSIITGGSFSPSLTGATLGDGAAVLVTGAITTGGTLGAGGSVNINSDSQIVVGGITTGGLTTSGNVTLNSVVPGPIVDGGIISVNGAINTAGLSLKNGTSATGGNILIDAPDYINISGNVTSTGGANTGASVGGTGGTITMSTTNSNPLNLFVGLIQIKGFVNSAGGASTTGTGGNASAINLTAGAVTVAASSGGISINANGGKGGVGGAKANVTVTVDPTQPLSTNLDLTSTKANVVSLPGQFFNIGGTGATTGDGTAGSIQGATVKVQNSALAPVVPGTHTMVTPTVALQQFVTSRGLVAPVGTVPVNDYDIAKPFTAFNLTAGTTLLVGGPRPVLTMSAPSTISGILSFGTVLGGLTPGVVALVDFGTSSMNIPAGGQVLADNVAPKSTIIFSSSGGAWKDNGLIQASNIDIGRNGTAALKFTLGTGGTFATSQILLSQSLAAAIPVNFQSAGGTFNAQVNFGNVVVPAVYQTLASQNALNFTKAEAVTLNFGLFNGALAPTPVTVGGTLAAGAVTITTTTVSAPNLPNPPVTILTPLTIAANSAISGSSVSITSAATLTVDDNATISGTVATAPVKLTAAQQLTIGAVAGANIVGGIVGGSIKGTVTLTGNGAGAVTINGGALTSIVGGTALTINGKGTASGVIINNATLKSGSLTVLPPLPPTSISKTTVNVTGSLTINNAGTGGIAIANSSLNSNGLSTLTISNTNKSGTVTIDGSSIKATGGTVKITNLGTVGIDTIGSGSLISAQQVGTSLGSVSITGNGVTVGQGAVTTQLMAGSTMTVTGGTTGVSIDNALISALTTDTITGGAITVNGPGGVLISGNTGLTMTSTGTITINGENLSSLNGSKGGPIRISGAGAGGVTIGSTSNVTLSASTNISVTASNVAGTLTIGNNATFNAGLLNGPPPAGALTAANITKAGTLTLTSNGSGGLAIGTGASLTSVGTMTVTSTKAGANMTLGSDTFNAFGGSMTISSKGTITDTGNTLLNAQKLNAGLGAITVTGTNGVTLGSLAAGSSVKAGTTVSMTSTAGPILLTKTPVTAGTSITMNGQQGITATGSALIGSNLTAGTSITMTSTGNALSKITLAGNTNLAAGSTLSMTATNGISIGANESITSGRTMTISSTGTGATSLVTIGNNTNISAGLLQIFAPPGGPFFTAEILSAGSLTITSAGSSGMSIGSNVNLTSNGSGATIKTTSTAATAILSLGGNDVLTANGGNLTVSAANTLTDAPGGNNTYEAATLNNGAGSVTITGGAGGVTLGAPGNADIVDAQASITVSATTATGNINLTDTTLAAVGSATVRGANVSLSGATAVSTNGAVSITGTGTTNITTTTGFPVTAGTSLTISGVDGVILGPNQTITSGTSMTITTTDTKLGTTGIVIGNNDQISAGSLSPGAVVPGPLTTSDIALAGSLTVRNAGQAGISVGTGVAMNSNGGSLTVTSTNAAVTAAVNIGANSQLGANGGSVTISSAATTQLGTGDNVTANTLNGGAGTVTLVGATGLTVLDSNVVLAPNGLTMSSVNGAVALGIGNLPAQLSTFTSNRAITTTAKTNITVTDSDLTAGSTIAMNVTGLAGTFNDNGGNNLYTTTTGAMTVTAKGNVVFGTTVNGANAGGSTIVAPGGITFTSSAGNVSILGANPNSSNLTASNGAITVSGSTGVTLTKAIMSDKLALKVTSATGNVNDTGNSSYTSTAGAISFTGHNVTIGGAAATTISALGTPSVTISATKGAVVLGNTSNISTKNGVLKISATSTVTLDADLTAGTGAITPITVLPATNTTIPFGQITTKGSISITSGTGTLSPGDITIGSGLIINSIGGNTTMTSTGAAPTATGIDMSTTANTKIEADGGNVIMLTSGAVKGGSGAVGTNDTFVARGYPTKAAGTTGPGGIIEIGAGSTASQIGTLNGKPAGTVPTAGALGPALQVIINNNPGSGATGVVRANLPATNPGTINLTGAGTNTATLWLNHGGMAFDASKGAALNLNGATFIVDAFTPIAYRYDVAPAADVMLEQDSEAAGEVSRLANIFVPGTVGAQVLTARDMNDNGGSTQKAKKASKVGKSTPAVLTMRSGEMFINPLFDTTIRTAVAEIKARKGALLTVSVEEFGLRVAACSGPGDVTVEVGGRTITMAPGEEIIISERMLQNNDRLKADGIGRRHFIDGALANGLYVTTCDISIISMMTNAQHLQSLRHPTTPMEKGITAKLLTGAAAVQTVTQSRGAYQSRQRETNNKQSEYTPVDYVR